MDGPSAFIIHLLEPKFGTDRMRSQVRGVVTRWQQRSESGLLPPLCTCGSLPKVLTPLPFVYEVSQRYSSLITGALPVRRCKKKKKKSFTSNSYPKHRQGQPCFVPTLRKGIPRMSSHLCESPTVTLGLTSPRSLCFFLIPLSHLVRKL